MGFTGPFHLLADRRGVGALPAQVADLHHPALLGDNADDPGADRHLDADAGVWIAAHG